MSVYNDEADWLVYINSTRTPFFNAIYREGHNTISFPVEGVSGGLHIELSYMKWSDYPWAIERKTEILQRLAQGVIAQAAPGCIAEIQENYISITKPKQASPAKEQPSSNKTVTSCPSCAQKLRAPLDRGELVLTCPKCRHSWTWGPN
jgi:hypothetical protein